jgi:hypothetical protein
MPEAKHFINGYGDITLNTAPLGAKLPRVRTVKKYTSFGI